MLIQVLAGPRQAGKTTVARQVLDEVDVPAHYASADEPALRDGAWIEAQWEIGRLRARESGRDGALLVLDEVQKIPGWSELVKRLWDEDTRSGLTLKVMLLGSSPLLMQRGLSESLAGRFEVVRVMHWSLAEMRQAFGWNLEQYLYFGGYPGAAPLIDDEGRWRRYVLDALVETTLSRDILLMTRVDKPALLRQLFRLGCDYSGQVLSYQKMVGQLQDAGNTTTLAHYLDLLWGAGMLVGLQQYLGRRVRQRGSSPKLLVLNTALMTSHGGRTFEEAHEDRDFWGRLVESAVGAHLLNSLAGTRTDVCYWRERGQEVDFVLSRNRRAAAIDVTSGRRKESLSGLNPFKRKHRSARALLVGGQGIPLEEFLETPGEEWVH
ncbi:MAG: ATP-binding protein [Armatimonadetes bacterium]|nr:ATP-binding protein [Armatimonadota bacterium]